MFQLVLLLYRIKFRASATCEWQLSQQRLCWRHKSSWVRLGWGEGKGISAPRSTYHAVLVLFRSVVHSCVPRVGPTGIYLCRVQFPEPEGKGNVLGTGSAPLWPSSFMKDFCAGCPWLWGQPGPGLVWHGYFLPIETLSSKGAP